MQEETDVWGTLTEHNSVIFHDNDVSAQNDAKLYHTSDANLSHNETYWALFLNHV